MQRQVRNGSGQTFVYHLSLEPSNDVPHFYDFGRKLCKIPHRNGTSHGEDLGLLFKAEFAPRFKEGNDNFNAQQTWLNYFMDFCKDGKMSGWTAVPKGETKNVQCMEFSRDKVSMEELPNMDKLLVWINFMNLVI